MIARLAGRIDSTAADSVVIDVAGVGYLVYCSARTLESLPAAGEAASLHVETHVREDHIHLYGFATLAERDWFRLLTTVQGVGTRVALGILSALSAERLADALLAGDADMLTQAPGVGPRLAGRILSELKDKAVPAGATAPGPRSRAGEGGSDAVHDAVSALVNLGYRRGEAHGAVTEAARALGSEVEVEALIRAGLRDLAS